MRWRCIRYAYKSIPEAAREEKKRERSMPDSPMLGRRSGAASKKHSVTITITTVMVMFLSGSR